MVHGNKRPTLPGRQIYLAVFNQILAVLPNKEKIDWKEVERLVRSKAKKPGYLEDPETLSDYDLAVMASKHIEQTLSEKCSLSDQKTKTLGKYLQLILFLGVDILMKYAQAGVLRFLEHQGPGFHFPPSKHESERAIS